MGMSWKLSKPKTMGVEVVADPYKDVREPLINYLKGEIGKTGPQYDGERVAGMTDQEKQSVTALNQYANRQPSQLRQIGTQFAEAVMGGDPSASPAYQAMKAAAKQNMAELQSNVADVYSGKGGYYSGARREKQAEEATNVTLALNQMLGQLYESGQNRAASLLPTVMSMAQDEENAPLQTAAALQQFGALPRALEQALMDANYEEWVRSNYDYPLQIATLAGNIQQAPMYETIQKQPTVFANILKGIFSQPWDKK